MYNNKVQDQVKELEKKMDGLRKKREEISSNLSEKMKAISSNSTKIGGFLIDGKDPKQVISDLSIDQKIAEGMQEAIKMLDQQIQTLDREISEVKSQAIRAEFEEGIKSLTPAAVSLVRQIDKLLEQFPPILEEFRRLDDMAKNKIYPNVGVESNDAYFALNAMVVSFRSYGGVMHRIERAKSVFEERLVK